MATYAMYVLPGEYWNCDTPGEDRSERGLIRNLVREALNLRRRIAKGANIESERKRYTTCLGDLESRLLRVGTRIGAMNWDTVKLALRAKKIIGIDMPSIYFDLLALAHFERVEHQTSLQSAKTPPPGSELGGSVFPPDLVEQHASEVERFAGSSFLNDKSTLQQIARQRISLLREIRALKAGFVEVAEELDNRDIAPPPPRELPAGLTPQQSAAVEPLQPTNLKGRKKMAARLVQAIDAALQTGGKVNMSDQPHEVSTQVLGQYLLAEPGRPTGQVRVIYADGSEAKPFPLRTLPGPAPSAGDAVELSIALMSMRHLELDPFVERAWYRNKEVSQTRPLAESDEYCFQYSLRELAELRDAYEDRKVLIRMYHTGFEPAAIGFYRAVVTELGARRGWMRVLPHFYRGGTQFEAGQTVWG